VSLNAAFYPQKSAEKCWWWPQPAAPSTGVLPALQGDWWTWQWCSCGQKRVLLLALGIRRHSSNCIAYELCGAGCAQDVRGLQTAHRGLLCTQDSSHGRPFSPSSFTFPTLAAQASGRSRSLYTSFVFGDRIFWSCSDASRVTSLPEHPVRMLKQAKPGSSNTKYSTADVQREAG
jgi:hypothetical protein